MSTDTDVRERTIRWADPLATLEQAAGLSGMEIMEAIRDGRLAPPPISQTIGFGKIEVEPGVVRFWLEPDESLYNPIGSVHGGVAATMLDSAMGCAIQTTLPAGQGYTTVDLHVRYLRPMSRDTGAVIAEGTVVNAGRRLVSAEGRITVEATGKVIATATTGCVLL